MNIDNGILYLDQKIEFEDCGKLIELSEQVNKVVVLSNDIHPAAFQVLFCISKEKEVEIEDEFNKRFLENLKFADS